MSNKIHDAIWKELCIDFHEDLQEYLSMNLQPEQDMSGLNLDTQRPIFNKFGTAVVLNKDGTWYYVDTPGYNGAS